MPKDNQNEMFVVVNETDNITGYKTRKECHADKSLIHRAIGIVLYNKKGEILIQKRSKYKDSHPGFYTISASGHVGKGESYLEAARRELWEELGVSTELKQIKIFLFKMSEETEMEALFTGHCNGPFEPDPEEVESIMWVEPEKVKDIMDKCTPFAQECLKNLITL